MNKFLPIFAAILIAPAAEARDFKGIGAETCAVYAMFLQFPQVFEAVLGTQLSTVQMTLEATGMPRNSFERDFILLCEEDETQTIEKVINRAFVKYREILQ